ncbi:hypothetical protein L7F22_016783 [Adiantum nelumboides]|nr:hypothetical protein [Adiantum nelumboides]
MSGLGGNSYTARKDRPKRTRQQIQDMINADLARRYPSDDEDIEGMDPLYVEEDDPNWLDEPDEGWGYKVSDLFKEDFGVVNRKKHNYDDDDEDAVNDIPEMDWDFQPERFSAADVDSASWTATVFGDPTPLVAIIYERYGKKGRECYHVLRELEDAANRMWEAKRLPPRTTKERKALKDAKKCYICEEEGHFANECPQRNSQNKDDKSDRKGKKPKPSAGLVPDLVGDQQNVDATELCRTWGKVRDQEVLVFFDPGARANFISLELASKLGIRAEEMGMTGEAGLACPGHSEAVTPILGKLRLHIQSFIDAEEFHIMPLHDCDVLLGIPWCYRLHAVVGTFHKKITLVHRGKTHVLDLVKINASLEEDLVTAIGVKEIPTFLFVKGGKLIHYQAGYLTADELLQIISYFFHGAARPKCLKIPPKEKASVKL